MPPGRYIDWPVEQMRKWYEEDGLTYQQIADLLGMSQKLVNKAGKRFGFAARRRGPKSGSEHTGWKGGRTVDKHGYILVYRPEHPHSNSNGYIREHRLVMEEKIGRLLEKGEVVHHIDENPANNHPDNLQLFANNGRHLAETLKGRCPRWTQEGKERIRQGLANKQANAIARQTQEPGATE